jgi:putative flippase GtrA
MWMKAAAVLKSYPAWLLQAVRFRLVGVLNTGIDLGVYVALTRGLAFFAVLPAAAKSLSYSAGLLNSYFTNRAWTFHSHASTRRALPLFVLANMLGLLLNTGMMSLVLGFLKLPEPAALAAATLSSLVWNFTASKCFVFHDSPGSADR